MASAGEVLVQIHGLVRERGGRRVLNGLDLEIRRGECVVLTGANASGKSTLFDVLAGHLAPHGGEVRVAGIDVAREPHGVRRRVGYVPEDLPLVEGLPAHQYLTLHAELLGIPRARRRDAVDTALARVGLEWHMTRAVESLSSGERRRLELAQAILGDRPVLLLDEPFAGVDPGSRAPFRESLRRMGEGRAMLLGTHRLEEADTLATRMVILSRGEIAASIDAGAAKRVERVFLRVEGPGKPGALPGLAEALRFTAGVAEVMPDGGVAGGGGYWITPVEGMDPRAAIARAAMERELDIVTLSSAEPRLQDAYRRWHAARLGVAPAGPPAGATMKATADAPSAPSAKATSDASATAAAKTTADAQSAPSAKATSDASATAAAKAPADATAPSAKAPPDAAAPSAKAPSAAAAPLAKAPPDAPGPSAKAPPDAAAPSAKAPAPAAKVPPDAPGTAATNATAGGPAAPPANAPADAPAAEPTKGAQGGAHGG